MYRKIGCEISGDVPPEDSSCSFVIKSPVTLAKIKAAFPYEGEFHFRMRLFGWQVGMTDVDCIWLDLNNPNEVIPFDDNDIELQALPLDEPDRAVDTFYEKYLKTRKDAYYERQQRNRGSADNEATSDDFFEANNTLGKVFSNIAIGVKKGAEKVAPLSNVININTVKTGASSIWNAVKATATAIQKSAFSEVIIPEKALDILSDLSDLLSAQFKETEPQHLQLLERLWKVSFPNENYQRDSATWKQAGWQKNDPIVDLKASGLLALHCMIYFGETYPERSQKMIVNNKANTKTNYPYAIVGINLTLMLAELFSLRDNKFTNVAAGYWEMFKEEHAFYEVFVICFNHIDSLWTHRNAVRADFSKIIVEVKTMVSHVLARNPISIQDFKYIAADEGMIVID